MIAHLPRCTKLTDPTRYACNCGADAQNELAAKLDAADPLATVPAEERTRILEAAGRSARETPFSQDAARDATIAREVAAWHAAHPARAEGLPLFDGPPRSLYQPNGPDGSPEDCDPETLTPAEEAEIIASAPGQIGPGQTPIGDAERDPCAVREGYCGALSARAMACTRKPHTDGDHVAEGAIGEVIERWTTAAARVTEDELAEIERAAKQIRDGNWPPPGAATILLCERTSDLADEVRALRGERDQSAHTIAALQAERESENEGARRLMARVAALESELAARPAPAVDCDHRAGGEASIAGTCADCGVDFADLPDAPGADASEDARAQEAWEVFGDTAHKTGSEAAAWLAVVRAVDASRPAAPEVDAEDLWADYRTERPHMTIADRVAFLAGVEAGRRTSDASRPGLTEEQADAIALGCLQVREDLQRHAIKRAILRVDRGETGPATEPTRAERVAEAQRLRAEARAEAEACTVPMPADLLARYPRSADPPQPDRPSGLTRAMHDAQTRPSVAPASPFGEWPEPAHREAAAVHPTTAPTTTKDPSQ